MITIADQAEGLRRRMRPRGKSSGPVFIAISSYKGGVGKSSIALNLGVALGNLGRKVLVVDANFGSGGLDVVAGISARQTLSDVLKTGVAIGDTVERVSKNIDLISSSAGDSRLAQAGAEELDFIFLGIDRFAKGYDVIFVDCGSGIGWHSRTAISYCDHVMIITTPEPASIAGSYSFMREVEGRNRDKHFSFIVAKAKDLVEAKHARDKLLAMCEKFIGRRPAYVGMIPHDENMQDSSMRQAICIVAHPKSPASQAFESIARSIAGIKNQNSSWIGDKLLGMLSYGAIKAKARAVAGI